MKRKGFISISAIGNPRQVEYAPVPKVCPKCGRKVRRVGNASNREAHCEGYLGAVVDGKAVRFCDWTERVWDGPFVTPGGIEIGRVTP